MKPKDKGLTIIEMLVVLGIIATIAGLLIPATQAVRRYAKNTQQQVQFTNISTALEAWKNDDSLGQYPPSSEHLLPELSGAQNLATALFGLDMRGYHPATRLDSSVIDDVTSYYQLPGGPAATDDNISQRREHYLDMTVARPFRIWNDTAGNRPGLFDDLAGLDDLPYSYVLCDVFDYKSRLMPIMDGGGAVISTKTVKVGSPILYFRANIHGTDLLPDPADTSYGDSTVIYQYGDNQDIVTLRHNDNGGTPIPTGAFNDADHDAFYNQIRNPAAPSWTDGVYSNQGLPYRKDSYLLISAGADGIYGTKDDVTNFGD